MVLQAQFQNNPITSCIVWEARTAQLATEMAAEGSLGVSGNNIQGRQQGHIHPEVYKPNMVVAVRILSR